MGLSRESCSTNKQSNKVTQCPKLKIFKLMEQKDLDSEKIKLLTNKNEKKKKSESSAKIVQELYDSSSTDRFELPKPKSNTAQHRERFGYGRRTVFEDQQNKLRETPSRVSCALKKLLGSEYACVGCLAIAFVLSVLAGLLLISRAIPSSDHMTDYNYNSNARGVKEKRQLSDYDIFEGRKFRETSFDDGYQFSAYITATAKDAFEYTDLPEEFSNDDLNDVLDGNVMNSDNEKLRDFYKKLVETDAKIKSLKQNLQSNYFKSRNYNHDLQRIKRSLNKTLAGVNNNQPISYQENKHLSNKTRRKRLSDGVYGIVIKEQQVIVYDPSRRKNSKKTFHSIDRKINKKHFMRPLCEHKQQFDHSVTENKHKLKENSGCRNNIDTINCGEKRIQKDQVNAPSISNNSLVINDATSENLDIPSNIRIHKEDDIFQNPNNIVRHQRLFPLKNNNKAEHNRNISIPNALLRKGRSLLSFQEIESRETQGERVLDDNYKDSDNLDNGYFKSRRSFHYDTSELTSTSTLNTLTNFTFNKASADLDGNILVEKSPVHEDIEAVDGNKENNSTASYDTFYTTTLISKTEMKRDVNSKLDYLDEHYNDKEYGVKLDYLKNKIRKGRFYDKSKNSKDWFKAGLRNVMHGKTLTEKNKRKLFGFSTKAMTAKKSFQSMADQRKIRTVKYDDDNDMENIFKKLNAKMESVCRRAANAIQNPRNIKVRESKADTTTLSLMQRVVRMMRDLVDIQVQEKTCVELPPDLRQFLEWLVPPTESNPQADDLNPDISDYVAAKREYGGKMASSITTEQPLSFTDDDQPKVDRIQGLETIRAVKNLVDQYEELPNNDKDKLFGVKDYLHRQLQYLNKLIGDVDTENDNSYREPENRFKREINKTKHKRKIFKGMKNSRLRHFMRRLKMKHAKATTQEMGRSVANNSFTVKADKEISFTGQLQRNFNDVYNRALEEARRISTEDINITIT